MDTQQCTLLLEVEGFVLDEVQGLVLGDVKGLAISKDLIFALFDHYLNSEDGQKLELLFKYIRTCSTAVSL
jgi:hypothetical protein